MAEKKTTKKATKTTTKKPAAKKKTATKKVSTKHEHNVLAALSYVGILFLIPMFMQPKNAYVQFHVKQGMVVFGYELIALALLFTIIFAAVTPVLLMIAFALSGYGFVSALAGKKAKILGADWLIKHFNI